MKNKSILFSALACVGVGAVAFLSGKNTLKYQKIAREEKPEKVADKAKVIAKSYWPTGLAMGGTIFCIIFAQKINSKQIATMAGAAAFMQQKYKKYREKVIEEIGPEREQKIQAEIANDEWCVYPLLPQHMISETRLFYDTFSGLFFYATVDRVKDAMYHANRMVQLNGYVTMDTFYDYIGINAEHLKKVENMTMFGWSDDYLIEELGLAPWVDFSIINEKLDDGTEYIAIYYDWDPTFLEDGKYI